MRFREKATILNYIDNDDDNNYNTNGMFSQFAEHLSWGKFANVTQASFVVNLLMLVLRSKIQFVLLLFPFLSILGRYLIS